MSNIVRHERGAQHIGNSAVSGTPWRAIDLRVIVAEESGTGRATEDGSPPESGLEPERDEYRHGEQNIRWPHQDGNPQRQSAEPPEFPRFTSEEGGVQNRERPEHGRQVTH